MIVNLLGLNIIDEEWLKCLLCKTQNYLELIQNTLISCFDKRHEITKILHCLNVFISVSNTKRIVFHLTLFTHQDFIILNTYNIMNWFHVLCSITLMWPRHSLCIPLILIMIASIWVLTPFREFWIFYHIYLVRWYSFNPFFGMLLY